MNKNLRNMLKYSAVSIALVTSCNASTIASEPVKSVNSVKPVKSAGPAFKKDKLVYSCVTVKDEKFNINVIKNKKSCWVTVDGRKQVTVENSDTLSPFYSLIKGLPTGVSDGKEFYTIGLTTCNKATKKDIVQ